MIDNIETITMDDKRYPKQLKHIYNAPKILYVKGNTEILGKLGIAVIGCRDNTKYGELIAKNLGYNLAKHGINVISGLAKGVDSFAHIGAIYAKGKTIAVLGDGLDRIYPKENIKIAEKILEYGGAIVSEYPIGTSIDKMHFLERNRIISGLSKGVVVVEAKERSGALNTVEHALEQGRDVYAVPGNVTARHSFSTNLLIKEGAIPVTSYKDILFNL